MEQLINSKLPSMINKSGTSQMSPEEIQLKVKLTFGYLRDLTEQEFNSICVERAQVGNEIDTNWTDADYNRPCLLVGYVKTDISKWYYILFWAKNKLFLGRYAVKADSMGLDWKRRLNSHGSNYYCTSAVAF